MKKIIYFLLSLTVLAASCVKVGPTGPSGTAGIAGASGKDGVNGKDGTNGTDGTATCSSCHNNDMKLYSAQMQYNKSSHAEGFNSSMQNKAECSGCHNNEGFNQRIEDGSFSGLPASGFVNATQISCYTCHSIHKKFDQSDYTLKTTNPVSLLVNPSIIVNMGKSNLCLSCHQSKAYTIANLPVAATTDMISITSENFGPHGGAQGNLYNGVGKSGAFEIPGAVTYVNSMHTSYLSNACISCHMGKNTSGALGGGHSMSMKSVDDSWNTGACVACHSNTTTLNTMIDDSRSEIDSLRDLLETKLVDKGWIYLNSDYKYVVKASSTSPLTVTALQARVIYNYFFLWADHSGSGVHNYRYAKALASNSLDLAKTW